MKKKNKTTTHPSPRPSLRVQRQAVPPSRRGLDDPGAEQGRDPAGLPLGGGRGRRGGNAVVAVVVVGCRAQLLILLLLLAARRRSVPERAPRVPAPRQHPPLGVQRQRAPRPGDERAAVERAAAQARAEERLDDFRGEDVGGAVEAELAVLVDSCGFLFFFVFP